MEMTNISEMDQRSQLDPTTGKLMHRGTNSIYNMH